MDAVLVAGLDVHALKPHLSPAISSGGQSREEERGPSGDRRVNREGGRSKPSKSTDGGDGGNDDDDDDDDNDDGE